MFSTMPIFANDIVIISVKTGILFLLLFFLFCFVLVDFHFTFVEKKNKKWIGPLMRKTKGYSSLPMFAF